jgi:AcrR family transcriptional regulator
MRQLALEAGMSVATLYNLIGGRDEIIRALWVDVIGDLDRAVDDLNVTSKDPLDRARQILTLATEAATKEVPRALLFALLSEPTLYRDLRPRFRPQEMLAEAMDAMVGAGMLTEELSVVVIAKQVWSSQANYLRQWAAGALNKQQVLDAVMHQFDLCLIGLATPTTRIRLLDDARSRENDLQHL